MRSINEIIELKTSLLHDNSNRDAVFDKLTGYYNGSMQLGIMPSDIEVYVPPTARSQVDDATDHLMALKQRVVVPLWAETQKAKETASVLQRFGESFLQWIESVHRHNIRRSCLKHGILYGMFCFKGPLYVPRFHNEEMDDDDWDSYLRQSFPFVFQSVHPRNIYLGNPIDPEFVIEVCPRKVFSIKDKWPEWDYGSLNLSDNVLWWEYWDAKQRAYFVTASKGKNGEQVISQEENIYGFVPYEIGYGGFGMESEDGKPEDLCVSMIAPALSSYKMEARLKTALSAELEYGVYGKPTTNVPPGEDFIDAIAPGERSVHPEHYNFRYEETPRANPEAYRMLQLINDDQQKVMPSVVQGVWPKGVTSGYMGAISVGQARLSLEGLKTSWCIATGNKLNHVTRLVKDVVMEPIGLLGNFSTGKSMQTIKPEILNPDIQRFYVQLDAESPEMRDRRIMLGLRLLSQGALSWETITREYFDADPDIEMNRKLVEAALNSPIIQQGLAVAAAQDMGMHELIEMIKQGALQAPSQLQPQNQGKPITDRMAQDTMRSKMRLEQGTGEIGSRAEMEGAYEAI